MPPITCNTTFVPETPLMTSTTHPIKEFFTEEQWNMIFNALSEYRDHDEIDHDLLFDTIHQISDLFID